jgi:hypothetical protein
LDVMTIVQDKKEAPTLSWLSGALPKVDRTTPQTMVLKLVISTLVNTSRPHVTANTALVIGSDALIVSTNAADDDSNPRFVQKNPRLKQKPARHRYLVCECCINRISVCRLIQR